MGYGSCPMIGFDIEKVTERINLPEDHVMGRWLPFARGRKTYVLNQVSCHWMKWWLKTVFDGSDINQFDNYLTIVTIISR